MSKQISKIEEFKLIDWSEAYSVGHKEIDEQHKTLIGLINTLIKFQNDKDRLLLKKILNTLVAYTEKHFDFEEKMLKEVGYAELNEHKEQHRKFIKQVEDFTKKYNLNQTDLSSEVLKFLRQWLTTHILIHDKEYADSLKV